jgi:hypothetical protein
MDEAFDPLLDPLLAGRHQPAREQLQLATLLVVQDAFYRVREAEAQAFFGLAEAEATAPDLNGLLRRFVRVLTRAGTLVMFDPGERRSVSSAVGARVLLLLAPWPAGGHDGGSAGEVEACVSRQGVSDGGELVADQ